MLKISEGDLGFKYGLRVEAWGVGEGVWRPIRGASGSPVFYGPTVYGMYTHSNNVTGQYWWFIRAQAVQSRMAQAQAAVGGTVRMICYHSDDCVPE